MATHSSIVGKKGHKKWDHRDDMVVGAIPIKEGYEELRIILQKFNRREFLNCRLVVRQYGGEWAFTKKGFTIPLDLVGELSQIVEKAVRALDGDEAETEPEMDEPVETEEPSSREA